MEIKYIELDGERVCLKKSFDGWRVVYPIKNEDGSNNIFNFITGGSYWKLIKLGLLIAFIFLVIFAYTHDMSICKELLECGASCGNQIISLPIK